MRLIDADRLKAKIMGWRVVTDDLFGMGKYHEREIVLQAIEESPSINVVPVVRGEWVKSDYYKSCLVCSACRDCYVDNTWVNGKKWRYCPNCGAKMDRERK